MIDEQATQEEHPTVELRVYRHGALCHSQLFESEEQATYAMAAWADVEGVEFTVGDLSVRHGPEDILEEEPEALAPDDGYPPTDVAEATPPA